MLNNWKSCVAAILITGSTSSISGASEAACAAPHPINAEAALSARPAATELPIPYREEIFHPAILDPVVTKGTFDLGRNQTLIRSQIEPRVESVEIGTRLITVRREDYENTNFIPARLKPLMSVLRGIVLGERLPTNAFASRLDAAEEGWALSLMPEGAESEISLRGCGEVLTAIHFTTESGERRETHFMRSQ